MIHSHPPRLLTRSVVTLFAVLLAATVSPSLARAQHEDFPARHVLRLGASLNELLGKPQSDEFELGYGGAVGYEFRFSGELGVGADYAGHAFPVAEPDSNRMGSFHGFGPTADIHPLGVDAAIDLRLEFGPDIVLTGSRVRAGLHAGLAADLPVSRTVALGAFVRYRHGFAPGDGQEAADPKLLSFGVELALTLGGASEDGTDAASDQDGDGVPDDSDRCPAATEDRDGVQDEDGCPDPDDTDGDGLAGSSDRCPDASENYNGFEDQDGCPDQAPGAPVQVTPVAPVTPAPVQSTPVASPSAPPARSTPTPAPVADEPPPTLPSLGCDTGVAEVRPQFASALDEVARVMTERPTLRIVVVGHADPRGTDAFNQDLSRRRAMTVRDELVRRGVPARRIRTVWYGERRPIDPGMDEQANANNRRVEILAETRRGR